MDTYKLNFTTLQSRIFRLLCINVGKPLNQRQIAAALDVSPTAVGKSLEGLGRLVMIQKDPRMNLSSVTLNREEKKAIELKRAENLEQIYESGLVDHLEEKLPGSTIILFGSYSRGEDTVKSDIDIAVIGSKEKRMDLSRFENILGRTIIVNFYENMKIDKNLKQSLINGITLQGMIEA
ncbi:nucleotidyltransferase domain-containing protein [Candidatus Woesearchaeota archaeon]|nr:nucleotidyltransferase domain-containing protein [Candidatus Woesearchaeota archaeon]